MKKFKAPQLLHQVIYLKKFSSNSKTDAQSVDATDQLETISEHSEPNNEDNKDLSEKSEDEDMDVSTSNLESEKECDVIKNNAVIEKASECQNSDKMLSAGTTDKKVVNDEVRWNSFLLIYHTVQYCSEITYSNSAVRLRFGCS